MPDDAVFTDRSATQAASPLRVKGLDHVVLCVSDIDRAIAFYEQVLGLHVERRLTEIGLVQLRAGSCDDRPRAATRKASPTAATWIISRFRSKAWMSKRYRAHLRRHGVDPGEVRRRYGAEGYGSSIYITDPDGNTVELKGPPEPGQAIPGR